MRLTPYERDTLKHAAQASFEPGVVIRLFGSRVSDDRRGGDIDLLIETQLRDPERIAWAHTRFLSSVYARLGEQKIDVLIDYPDRRQKPAIFEVARQQGVVL
jgi:predicted nucleotidyltransferase